MFKIFKADKDTYITNKVIKNDVSSSFNSNVGIASSLDLYKLYGMTLSGTVPNRELSRILIHFDISDLRGLVSSGNIDYTHNSFFAKLKLFDVYGGQTTPDNYTISVSPLSMSFDEGKGKDVVMYSDRGVSNFITASSPNIPWKEIGCYKSGAIGDSCDYITGSSAVGVLSTTQYFKTGEEDLYVDVTKIISCTLSNQIPDSGFRISFSTTEENNNYTYFVKRFASRHAYDESKHPRLEVGFDDSIVDTSQGMTFDTKETMFLWNYDHGKPANIPSGSSLVVGNNSLLLKLQLELSGAPNGFREFIFTGSQHSAGNNFVTGVYSASIYLSSSNQYISQALTMTGSTIKLTPIWGSLDGTVAYHTGSKVSFSSVSTFSRGNVTFSPKKFNVSVTGLNNVHASDEMVMVRVNVFDYTSPLITLSRVPTESPGALQGIISNAFYSVRNTNTQKVIIPFDTLKGSTRISCDSHGLFFKLDTTNLVKEQSYVIDIKMLVAGEYQLYKNVSPIFKISDSR
jgi:hypothetical protein